MSMYSEQFSVPDLPMPKDRVQARHEALVREINGPGRTNPWPARRRLAVSLASACVLAAGMAIATMSTDRSSLAASWSANPGSLSAADAGTAIRACQERLGEQHWPINATGMEAVLAERRNKLTAVLLGGADRYGMCIGDPGAPLFVGVGAAGTFGSADILVLDGVPGRINGTDAFRVAYGQVASTVTRIIIDAADGKRIEATVADGRFFAWWPSGADPSTITALAPDGHVLKVLSPTPTPTTPIPVRRPGTR